MSTQEDSREARDSGESAESGESTEPATPAKEDLPGYPTDSSEKPHG